jgi:hypothetical protein
MRWWRSVPVVAAVLMLSACSATPRGPSVMVLPGPGKALDQFQLDDAACRQWATQQLGPRGDSSWMMQRRYDIAYQQCMYSRGNQIPGVTRSSGPPAPPPPRPGQRVPSPPPDAITPPPDAPPPPAPPPRP